MKRLHLLPPLLSLMVILFAARLACIDMVQDPVWAATNQAFQTAYARTPTQPVRSFSLAQQAGCPTATPVCAVVIVTATPTMTPTVSGDTSATATATPHSTPTQILTL